MGQARFEQALEGAEALREMLASLQDAERYPRLARLEVVAATVYVAFGDSAAALASLERALGANPSIELDPQTTSPKVMEVYWVARRQVPLP